MLEFFTKASTGKVNHFRTLYHSSSGLIIVLLLKVNYPSKRLALIVLAAASLGLFALDMLRLFTNAGERFCNKYIGFLLSDKDRCRFNSSFYYAISLFFSVLIFSPRIAMGAIICLSVGDPVAKIAGLTFGRIRILGKTLEGTLAGFVVCFFIIRLIVPSGAVAFTGALAGACIELVPIPKVDDNLIIPLFSGLAMTVASALFGG